MGHSITAILLKGNFDPEKAVEFDLVGQDIGFGITLFHIDHYYSACWQYKLKTIGHLELSGVKSIVFPNELSLAEIMKRITNADASPYAIIQTDYFGGLGSQCANVFHGSNNADKSVTTINNALKHLGVVAKDNLDEFDTVRLDKIRNQPDFLERYWCWRMNLDCNV